MPLLPLMPLLHLRFASQSMARFPVREVLRFSLRLHTQVSRKFASLDQISSSVKGGQKIAGRPRFLRLPSLTKLETRKSRSRDGCSWSKNDVGTQHGSYTNTFERRTSTHVFGRLFTGIEHANPFHLRALDMRDGPFSRFLQLARIQRVTRPDPPVLPLRPDPHTRTEHPYAPVRLRWSRARGRRQGRTQ